MTKQQEEVPLRAMNAAEAGVLLAQLIGLKQPIPAQRMWRLTRVGLIPSVRLGRRVLFQSTALERIASSGGVTFHSLEGAE